MVSYGELIAKIEYAALLCAALETHQSIESRELMLSDLIANLSDALGEAE